VPILAEGTPAPRSDGAPAPPLALVMVFARGERAAAEVTLDAAEPDPISMLLERHHGRRERLPDGTTLISLALSGEHGE
jgi:hypothetical protein